MNGRVLYPALLFAPLATLGVLAIPKPRADLHRVFPEAEHHTVAFQDKTLEDYAVKNGDGEEFDRVVAELTKSGFVYSRQTKGAVVLEGKEGDSVTVNRPANLVGETKTHWILEGSYGVKVRCLKTGPKPPQFGDVHITHVHEASPYCRFKNWLAL